MSLPHWVSMASTSVLLVGACISPGSRPLGTVTPDDLVVVGSASGVTALDWDNRRILYQAATAVATPDWSRLVVSSSNGDGGTLGVLDGRTGAREASKDVPGGLTAMVLSADGRHVALAPPSTASDTPLPVGRDTTRIVVADPSGAVEPRIYDLPGNYEPDAFATDNRFLFVLEYQPARAPDRYLVRRLDLLTGSVSGVGSRSKEAVPEENMRGTRRMHVLSPDHHTLYTLYTHQPDHLHSRDLAAGVTSSSGAVHAFVHVLSLSEGWAYCLDLPQPFGVGAASAHSLALSPDGNELYAADRSSGMVALIDTHQLVVQGTADVGADPNAAGGLAATRVSSDGSLYLSGGSDIVVVEPRALAVLRRLHVPGPTSGLGMSLDGLRLFITTGDSVLSVDPQTGAELGRYAAPGSEGIEYVGTTAKP